MSEKNQNANPPVPVQGKRSLTTSHQAGMINRPNRGQVNQNSSRAQGEKPKYRTGVDEKQNGKP
ncbi:MAG: hypothetical protein OXG03_07505 [Gammaproteobacteria bacterium]|nr:hypothetical protein [Gammaproteobacteria bacterium]